MFVKKKNIYLRNPGVDVGLIIYIHTYTHTPTYKSLHTHLHENIIRSKFLCFFRDKEPCDEVITKN